MTTIGVAIPVPEPWAGELQRCRAGVGDPLAEAIPVHVTLVPPTAVSGTLDAVGEHLKRAAKAVAPFVLRLHGTATFRPVSPVVFIAVTEGISSCEVLAAAAREGLLDQPLRFPYHPHVTVAHDLDDAALDQAFDELSEFSCAFDVDSFSLYVHGDDGVWRPERSFRLHAAD